MQISQSAVLGFPYEQDHSMHLNTISKKISNHFDDRVEELAFIIENLISNKGVYHLSIHYSSSQLVCWTYDNPYSYQVYTADEVFSKSFMRFFSPLQPKIHTCIQNNMIPSIVNVLQGLRQKECGSELRNASIHTINGYIGLAFACDDTRYINYKDFLLLED